MAKVFDTGILLGCWSAEVTIANAVMSDKYNEKSYKDAVLLSGFNISRTSSVMSGEGKIIFTDIDKAYILSLLNESEKLIQSYRKFITVISKIVNELNGTTFSLLSSNFITAIISILIANLRLLMKSSAVMHELTSTAFYIAKGNVKKSITIAKVFKAEMK